jgi:uncharacterized protein with PIN domain
MKFPVDAPKARVVRALRLLGFEIVRERTVCTQANIAREDFLTECRS